MFLSLGRAALGTGFTFLMTTLGAATVFLLREERTRASQGPLLGFAAGIMTAASVWSLLLPAIERSSRSALPGWLPAAVGVTLGVLFLAAVDLLLSRLHVFGSGGDDERQRTALLMAAVTVHNVPEGLAVGLAFALTAHGQQPAAAAALALGIGIQNFPEGAAISLPLREQGASRMRAFLGGALSGAVEPLFGILVVLIASAVEPLMPLLLSFAAGAMLYVVVEELIPQAKGLSGTVGFTVGFLIMMILDVALG